MSGRAPGSATVCFRASLLCGALVLTFDQVAFFTGLHMLTGAGLAVLVGGWIAKMGAVLLYSVLAAVYLVYLERPLGSRRSAPHIADVFDTLTYRERYEDLLARTSSDALTGTLDRHSLESHGRRAVEMAASVGRPLALLVIDLDHFKAFNDRFGHAAGDVMLKSIANEIIAAGAPPISSTATAVRNSSSSPMAWGAMTRSLSANASAAALPARTRRRG